MKLTWALAAAVTVLSCGDGGNAGTAGNATSETVIAQPPPVPMDVEASTGANEVTLTWSRVASATAYNIYVSLAVDGPFTLLNTVTATNVTATNLSNDVTYYFTVRAVNGAGEGSASQVVAARPGHSPTSGRKGTGGEDDGNDANRGRDQNQG